MIWDILTRDRNARQIDHIKSEAVFLSISMLQSLV